MSTGDVRRSQSANFFKTTRRNEEEINQRPKRFRAENPSTAEIVVDAPSTSTLVEENVNLNPNLLTPPNHDEKTNSFLAVKLNRLKDKQIRFESHKDFLSRCINESLVPKGLELMLEPTIGNHDQNFLDNWYSKLKNFSLTLMGDIVKFCDKTITETNVEINKTETSLKASTDQEQFQAIKNEIINNEEAAKKALQQKKFKKFNNLKYKPKHTSQPNPQQASGTNEQPKKSLYSDILKRKKSNSTLNKKSSETNLQPNKPDTIQKLKALNVNKTKGKQPSRNNSSTNQSEEESLKLQVEQLKQELNHLKNESNKQEHQKHKVTFINQAQVSKNEQEASTNNGGQQQKVEILSVITYIEETMKTLKDFGEQLKIQLHTSPTH